jgi:PAS domain S-box-containing protein
MKTHLPENEILNIFMQANLAIGIYNGDDYTIGFANDLYLQILDSDKSIIGKPVFEVFPELINQGIKDVFDTIKQTKSPYFINEHGVFIGKDHKNKRYFNCSYQLIEDNQSIVVVFSEITDQVLIKSKNVASQQLLLDKLSLQNQEKQNRADELEIANKELLYQNQEKQNRADELEIANKELQFQKNEKQKRADELEIANNELLYQNQEKQNRADELEIANKELVFQNQEKQNRADELGVANIELAHQQSEKQDRADELGIANIELAHQQSEKQDRADELGIANIELAHQQSEKQDRANELGIANIELAHQQSEKKDRADELGIANIELAHQKSEKSNRANELIIANKELSFQDNEKIKRADELIIKNNQLLEAQTLGQIGSWDWDFITNEIFWTDEMYRIYGLKPQKIKINSTNFLIGVHPDDLDNLKAKTDSTIKTHKPFQSFYRIVRPDKTIRYINAVGKVYVDDKNKIIRMTGIAQDITDKKQALKQAYSRSLIEASHDPLVTINTEGKIMDMNQAMVKVSEKKYSQILNTNFSDYFTDSDKAKKVYQEVFDKGLVTNFPLIMKDGKLTDVLFNGSVYKDENNEVIGAVVVARDITEQKNAEAKLLQSLREVTDYKLALDASTIVDITDKNGKILFVNDNYLKISKYSYDELVGGNHQMVNSAFHPKDFMSNLWKAISKGKVWQDEIRNKAKDGSFYWLNMTIVPFLDDKSIPYQYVAISIDITKQKVLSQELTEAKVFAELATTIAEESRNNAEDAVKSKQQFLSNMSHEIRTPMNAIIGFTKVILKTELTAKQKEYLMAIKMSGDSLIVLINDILDLAKVDSGKMTFEKTPFKLAFTITSMLHLFETKIQEKNLKLITNYDEKIPEVLLGDPVRLNQIILNLVSNAVKFTNKGSITVSINLLSQDDEKATIEFEVTDTGIGIKPSKIGKIFENFQQATNTTSRLYGGTGLGLAIVKQLVEAQGGKIEIESKVNKGSTFSFVLDFQKTTINAVHEPEILELDSTIKNTKILVVEDMELNQLLMKTLLDDFGFECDITANGKLAIEKLKTKTYDIILMDLQMPEMNGFEATEYIRKKMKLEIPIIALTADVTTVDVEKCKAVGMNDYIAKPVDERLLYSKLIAFSKKPVVVIEHIKGQDHAKDKIKYVDMTYLSKLTKSDPNLMSQMINAYLQQTPPLLTAMKQSLIDKDWKMLQSAVHKMIPSFSIIGLSPNILEIAKRIQEYAFSIEISEDIHKLVLELENVCTQSCEELQIELDNLNKK